MRTAPSYWYQSSRSIQYYLLIPLSWLFCLLVSCRQLLYRYKILPSYRPPVPVIVVGNITAGGTGKTPLVIWLAQFLQTQGYRPGIISRGYGGRGDWPQQVSADSSYQAVGDEAVLLALHTQCPVAVGPKRPAVIQSLLAYHCVDLIISDDGLQHYGMQRDIEIAVVHGERRFGNGHCLPAGPLRERPSRLDRVDITIVNGSGLADEYTMSLIQRFAVQIKTGKKRPLSDFVNTPIHGVAGIGYPEGFFKQLRQAGMSLYPHCFPDHYPYQPKDLDFADSLPILMSEKDAVRCKEWANERLWSVVADLQVDDRFGKRLLLLLEQNKMANSSKKPIA